MERNSAHTPDRDVESVLAALRAENQELRARLEGLVADHTRHTAQAEERYRNLFEHAGDGVFCVDSQGRVVDWNASAERLFGYQPQEVLGRSLHILLGGDDVEETRLMMEKIHAGETLVNWETWCDTKGGKRRRVAMTFTPILDEKGSMAGGAAIVRDVSSGWEEWDNLLQRQQYLEDVVLRRSRELEDANQQLKHQDEMRSLFIASMSHELRTPLNSILGFTDLLMSGMSGALSEEQLKQIGIVHSAGQHLLAVINDIIDLSKIEAGQLVVSYSDFDLRSLVDSAVSMTSGRIDASRVELKVDVGPITVKSDPRRVKQIILNLLSNAIKYTSQGKILVEAERREGQIVVSVQDTGCGIAQDDIVRLFRPFQRVAGGENRPGTGLGLYLSQGLAAVLGGDITVVSTPVVGSRFSLVLPESPPRQEPVAAEA